MRVPDTPIAQALGTGERRERTSCDSRCYRAGRGGRGRALVGPAPGGPARAGGERWALIKAARGGGRSAHCCGARRAAHVSPQVGP